MIPDLPLPDADPRAFLTGLGLTCAEVDGLRRQGFVALEYRAYQGTRLGPYFKLRWRMERRQRVLYLGSDVAHAERVAHALACWQKAHVLKRQLAALITAARKNLQLAKKALAAPLANQGRRYHGYTSRRRRSGKAS